MKNRLCGDLTPEAGMSYADPVQVRNSNYLISCLFDLVDLQKNQKAEISEKHGSKADPVLPQQQRSLQSYLAITEKYYNLIIREKKQKDQEEDPNISKQDLGDSSLGVIDINSPDFPRLILQSIREGTEIIGNSKELLADPRREKIVKKIIHLQVSMLKWEKFEHFEYLRFLAAEQALEAFTFLDWGKIMQSCLSEATPDQGETISKSTSGMFKKKSVNQMIKPVEVSGEKLGIKEIINHIEIIFKPIKVPIIIILRFFKNNKDKDKMLADLPDTSLKLAQKLITKVNIRNLLSASELSSFKIEVFQLLENLLLMFKVILIQPEFRKTYATRGNINTAVDYLSVFRILSEKFDRSRNVEMCEVCLTCLSTSLQIVRNLAIDEPIQQILIETKCLQYITEILTQFPLSPEIVTNCVRILSSISISSVFCGILEENSDSLKSLLKIMDVYKENNYILMRIAFVLANMTTYNEAASSKLYFELSGFETIFSCFVHYISKASEDDNFMDTMLKSFSNFDFLKQSDKDVLNKVIRLLANIFTDEKSAMDFIKNRFSEYKFMLKKLRFFMNENEVMNNSELLICVLSCISNILYFDKPGLSANDFELQSLKQDLTSAIAYIILQPKQEEVLIEGLRVISNLSRSKQFVKHLLSIKFHEAVAVLIDHRSREVVYYSIGILINLTQDQEFKSSAVCLQIFHSLVDLLNECCIDDLDIIGCCLKALTNIIYENVKTDSDAVQQSFTKLDLSLQKFGEECDIILESNEISEEEAEEIKSLRQIINTVTNLIPEQLFQCQQCERKFETKEKLIDHARRRHPN